MENKRLLELINKKQAGEISPQELIELNRLVKENPAGGEFMDLLRGIWETPLDIGQEAGTGHIQERLHKLKQKIETGTYNEPAVHGTGKVKRISSFKYAAAAACVILMGVAAWWIVEKGGSVRPAHNNVVSTKKGSHSLITLPDGTEVWLNAGSNLTYNESFGKGTRELQLEGEAFFEVTKDSTRPFIIHTRTMNVKVLGTVFNVRAYPDEKTTEAALLEGSIEISLAARPSDRILLKPSEKISVRNEDPQLLKPDSPDSAVREKDSEESLSRPAITVSRITYDPIDSTVVEASWVKNKIIFRNKPFEELARDLERRYNVNIVIRDNNLLQKRFTGTFYNESVLEALDKLKVSYPIHYQYNKETGTITIE